MGHTVGVRTCRIDEQDDAVLPVSLLSSKLTNMVPIWEVCQRNYVTSTLDENRQPVALQYLHRISLHNFGEISFTR